MAILNYNPAKFVHSSEGSVSPGNSEKKFFFEFLSRFGFTIFQLVFLFLFVLQLLISVLILSELKSVRSDNKRAVQKALSPFTF